MASFLIISLITALSLFCFFCILLICLYRKKYKDQFSDYTFYNHCANGAYRDSFAEENPGKVFPLSLYANYSNFIWELLRKYIYFVIAMLVAYFFKWKCSFIYLFFVFLSWYTYRCRIIYFNSFDLQGMIERHKQTIIDINNSSCSNASATGHLIDENFDTDNFIMPLHMSMKDVLSVSIVPPIYITILYLTVMFFEGWYL